MKEAVLLAAVLAVLSAEAPAPPQPQRHLDYAFSTYDAARAPETGNIGDLTGPGTGTMSVDILGPAADGGVMISAQEWWWNAVRPQQSHTCEVYAQGGLSCDYIPSPSAAELVIFPLLAREYFAGLANSTWKNAYKVSFGNGYVETAVTANLRVTGAGDRRGVVKLVSDGDLMQLDRRYFKAHDVNVIAYDTKSAVPLTVHDVRMWTPDSSWFSASVVDLKLLKDSAAAR